MHLRFHCDHQYASGFRLHVQFEADERVTALVGPSGSGKTSVLALIAGLLKPRSGAIALKGRTLLDTAAGVCMPPEQRRVGLVFQDHCLFPHLSVRGNLEYGWKRRPRRRIEFQRAVDTLELGGLLDRSPHTLSGGEKQRVALGRAILRGPELLLLDEPVAALHHELKDRVLAFISRIIDEYRIPTLFVSHEPADVERLAQSVVRLEAGGRAADTGSGTSDAALSAAGGVRATVLPSRT
ncbi:MAG TPA: ATP-binding cassette domain-containing protein [Planctomycetaceae bacterium]|nr:ATP-binding cassette domain-containing protein [Planctomycetaceae bacterium]